MTIQEYWDKNIKSEWYTGEGKDEPMLWFVNRECGLVCWIDEGAVCICTDDCNTKHQLEHINTIDQYKQLCKLLTGEELVILANEL